jgi:hypothetical protein
MVSVIQVIIFYAFSSVSYMLLWVICLWLPTNHDSPKLVKIVRVKFPISSFGNFSQSSLMQTLAVDFHLKDRQQHPHTWSFALPRVKVEGPRWMQLL